MPFSRFRAGHSRFKEIFTGKKDFFLHLAEKGQNPRVLWIGCSDSRVVPEHIVGAEPGELFVLRNIANVVPPASMDDDAVGAVIEYAVLHLQLPDIVICGHTDCGGIKALYGHLDAKREPHICRWLELIWPLREQVKKSGVSEKMIVTETVKANLLMQRDNLLTYNCVQEAIKEGRLKVHCWLYDLHTGDLLAYDEESKQWNKLGS